jgi:hypothetical protein
VEGCKGMTEWADVLMLGEVLDELGVTIINDRHIT